MQNLQYKDLWAMSPHWLTKDPNINAILQAISKVRSELYAYLDNGALYKRIKSLDSQTLDHLATQWHVEVWRDFWPLEVKQKTLLNQIIFKPRLGTPAAIKEAIGAYGSAVYIKEWWEFEPKLTPHTFNVYIKQNDIEGLSSDEVMFDLKRLIDATKPVRSQYKFIVSWEGKSTLSLKQSGYGAVFFRYSMQSKPVLDGNAKVHLKQSLHKFTHIRFSDFKRQSNCLISSIKENSVKDNGQVKNQLIVKTSRTQIKVTF